jgi:hypothetical protein
MKSDSRNAIAPLLPPSPLYRDSQTHVEQTSPDVDAQQTQIAHPSHQDVILSIHVTKLAMTSWAPRQD